MGHISHGKRVFLSGLLVIVGIIAMTFYTNAIDTATPINPMTQSQVVMQGHDSLQIIDNWYEIG